MVQESINTGKRPMTRRKNGPVTAYEQVSDTGELYETRMKPGPFITNICISLLVMALFAVFFRL
jgi:hypothetical protein